MKKIIASTGLAALGAASLQAAYAPGLTAVQTAKPWSVSAAVRGFYDDNYNTRPTSPTDGLEAKRSSWGFDINPAASLNLPLEQTYIGLTYSYHMMYFQDRADLHQASADHVHQATATLSHQFSQHYSMDLSDSFTVAQQPELLVPGYSPLPIFTRVNGNNVMNDAKVHFRGDLTDRLGAELAYDNTISTWDDRGYTGSTASVLDRMVHLVTADLRWNWLPTTVGILGYQFGYTDYTSHDLTFDLYLPRIRNAESHYAFVGVDQTFTTQLSASARAGFEYTHYPNAHEFGPGVSDNSTSPYADANLTYAYNPGSYVKVGINHQRNATYLSALPGSATPLLDSEATAVYAMINHKITAKLTGNLLGSYQNSNYHVSGTPDKQDNFFNINAILTYQINQFLAAETSYNFYRLDSDLPNTSYTRNVVFFGVRATY